MIKKIICIECPNECVISVDVENDRIVKIGGDKCPKGTEYAASEIKNPMRTLTTSVLAEGLPFKMVPVKTDRPIPKSKLFEAMKEIRKIRIKKPVYAGNAVVKNFLGLGVDLVVTRDFFLS